MTRRRSTVAAIIGGSFAATATSAVAVFAFGSFQNSRLGIPLSFSLGAVQLALGTFAATWAFALIGASTLGLLWHRVALVRSWTNVLAYIFAGAALGAFLPAALTAPMMIADLGDPPPAEAWGMAFGMIFTVAGGIVGPLTALFAWLIRRPDRDAPANPTSTGS